MSIFQRIFTIQILDVKSLREVGPHIMRSTGLYSSSVFHHRFNRERIHGASEFLRRCLLPFDYRNREVVLTNC